MINQRNDLLESVIPFIWAKVKGDEDLFQEACVLMLKRLHHFDPELGTITTFTTTVIREVYRKRMTRGLKIPVVPVADVPQVSHIITDNVQAPENITFDFDVLDPFEEYLILQHYYEGVTQAELARLSGVSKSYLNAQISKALQKLKDAYLK